jgi:hypothetical protein
MYRLFKFKNRSSDVIVIRGQSDNFFLFLLVIALALLMAFNY